MPDKRGEMAEAWAEKEYDSDETARRSFLAGFNAGSEQMRDRAAAIPEGELLMDVSPPGQTKREHGANVCREVARRIRALPLDPKEAQDAEG